MHLDTYRGWILWKGLVKRFLWSCCTAWLLHLLWGRGFGQGVTLQPQAWRGQASRLTFLILEIVRKLWLFVPDQTKQRGKTEWTLSFFLPKKSSGGKKVLLTTSWCGQYWDSPPLQSCQGKEVWLFQSQMWITWDDLGWGGRAYLDIRRKQ